MADRQLGFGGVHADTAVAEGGNNRLIRVVQGGGDGHGKTGPHIAALTGPQEIPRRSGLPGMFGDGAEITRINGQAGLAIEAGGQGFEDLGGQERLLQKPRSQRLMGGGDVTQSPGGVF